MCRAERQYAVCTYCNQPLNIAKPQKVKRQRNVEPSVVRILLPVRNPILRVDDFVDVFEIRQIVSNQVAGLIWRILNFEDVLMEICEVFVDLIQINFIEIEFGSIPFDI